MKKLIFAVATIFALAIGLYAYRDKLETGCEDEVALAESGYSDIRVRFFSIKAGVHRKIHLRSLVCEDEIIRGHMSEETQEKVDQWLAEHGTIDYRGFPSAVGDFYIYKPGSRSDEFFVLRFKE